MSNYTLDDIENMLAKLEFEIEEGVWSIADCDDMDAQTEEVISYVRQYAAFVKIKKEQFPDE